MEYWTEDELKFEINIAKVMIDRWKTEMKMCKERLKHHEDRLSYLEGLTVNQTKINFDEQD